MKRHDLTDEQIKALEGDALSEAVADAMGWEETSCGGWWIRDNKQYILVEDWRPDRDANQALEVWAKMPRSALLEMFDGELTPNIAIRRNGEWVNAATAPFCVAICRAFLLAERERCAA